jgi:hypothetical protein
MIGDCSHSMSSGVVSEHLMAEVDRHHPISVGFEQPADRPGSGGDIEDQAAGSELYPTNHQPSPTPILAQAQDAGPTLIVPGYVPKQPRRGRLGFLFGTNRFDEDILVGSQRTVSFASLRGGPWETSAAQTGEPTWCRRYRKRIPNRAGVFSA